MKRKLLHFWALLAAILLTTQAYGQASQSLTLGNFNSEYGEGAYDGLGLQNSPMLFTYQHSGSQTLYQPEQLTALNGQQITSMTFRCYSEGNYSDYTSTMKLYLHEVDATEFTKNAAGKYEWMNFNQEEAIAVSETSVDFLNNDYANVDITFDLSQKPYVYSGKTLVVTITNDATSTIEGNARFYWIDNKATDPYRSLIFGSDTEDFIANQAKNNYLDGEEDKWKNAPAVQFTYVEAEKPEPPTPPTPTAGELKLGDYDTPDTAEAWDGFNLQNSPFMFTYLHSGSQVMYTAEQLASMKGQQINTMTFKCFTEDCYVESYSSTMKLYLQEVDATEFTYNTVAERYEWVPFDQSKVLATTELTFSPLDHYMSGEDIEVSFDLSKNPYVYTGKTLVVTITNDTEQCIDGSEGSIRFYWIPSPKKEDPFRSQVFASDQIDFLTNFAKDNVIKTTDNEDRWKEAPMVKFTYSPAENPEPPVVVTYPEALYVIGNLPNHDWDSTCADFVLTQDTQKEGTYKGNVTLAAATAEGNGSFKLTAKTGEGWESYTYAGKTDGEILPLDTPTQLIGGYKGEGQTNGNANSFQLKGEREYEFTVDLTDAENMTITAKDITPEPPTPPTPPTAGELKLGDYDTPDTAEAWDGFNLQNSPIMFTYLHSGSQVMYTAEQLASMKGQQINTMTFKCFTEDCYVESYSSTMKLYLQEVDEKEFIYDTASERYQWVPFDQSKVLATTELTFSPLDHYMSGEDIEVSFDLSKNPYIYTGKTLVVTITNDTEQCIDGSEGSIRFYWIPSPKKEDPFRSQVFASDHTDFLTNFAKDNVIKGEDNENRWKEAPMVKFTYGPADTPEPPVQQDFSGGKGTAEEPYLIGSLKDLETLNQWANQGKTNDTYFQLTQDLTEEPFTGMIGTEADFMGHFDGNNHAIALNINNPEADYVGLFQFVVGGSVKNLILEGQVNGKNYTGALAGQIGNATTIENILNKANVTANMFVGGIVGQVITQDPSPSCKVIQCANYGTVTGAYVTGGIIGDSGQQVGNIFKRMANYGHINCGSKAGGLIGNARPYDQMYFGLNMGTAEGKSRGCIGNTKSSTMGNLFYDRQLYTTESENPVQAKNTVDMIGSALMSTEADNDFSENYWLFAEHMYPRLKVCGQEESDIALLYATPVLLAENDMVGNITKDFTVNTDNNVQWTSQNGNIVIEGNKATLAKNGEDVLVATLNGISREIKVNVAKQTGICRPMEDVQNIVTAEAGYIVLELGEDAPVQVMDVTGKMIAQQTFTAGTHRIAVESGIYIVRIQAQSQKVCVF